MSRRKNTSDFIRRKQLDGGLDTIPITVETDVHDRKLRALLGRHGKSFLAPASP